MAWWLLDARLPINTPSSDMPNLATLRRTLFELLSVRFIELQKQRRRP
ncbi:hypothetical protein [Trinickia mobilis]|nr:hypothetical protein [Trinickia mobilis]